MKIYLILFSMLFLSLYSSISLAEFLPTSFSSKFEQEYVSTLKGKIKKGEGSIDYKYPGQIRLETSLPSAVIFTSNGTRAWYYRAPFIEGEEGEVTESSAQDGSTAFIKFFDSLKQGLISNSIYDVKSGDPTVITFKPKAQKEFGINKSSIYFKSKSGKNFSDIEAIELTLADGKKSKLKFLELKSDIKFSANHFIFSPPTNTKKVN
ncbi:MAG: outer membrane lipoprotein carrier protein LolA [Bacteriovoracaceae bacterium]|nr:outer membrane lipoprotein carrier protein LolA [Bacteriovoracaceae bacterium]